MTPADYLRTLRDRVAELPNHSVSGYEWECMCDGEECAHYEDEGVVGRKAVLALLALPE